MPALALSIPYSGTLPWATEPATSTELTTSFPPTPYRTKQPPRTPYKKVSSPIRATWKPPPRHSSMATYRPSMPEPEPPSAALTVAQLYPKPESIRRTPLKCKPTRFNSAAQQLPPAKSRMQTLRPPISAKSQPLLPAWRGIWTAVSKRECASATNSRRKVRITMVASEKTLPINVAAAADLPPGAQQQQYSPLPSVFRAIEYNLPPNYRRLHDTERGYHWIYRVTKTNLSARIYPNVD